MSIDIDALKDAMNTATSRRNPIDGYLNQLKENSETEAYELLHGALRAPHLYTAVQVAGFFRMTGAEVRQSQVEYWRRRENVRSTHDN